MCFKSGLREWLMRHQVPSVVMVKFCNGTWTYVFLTDVGYEIGFSSGKYTIPVRKGAWASKIPKVESGFSTEVGWKGVFYCFLHVFVLFPEFPESRGFDNSKVMIGTRQELHQLAQVHGACLCCHLGFRNSGTLVETSWKITGPLGCPRKLGSMVRINGLCPQYTPIYK